jgi:hypothetical protein
MNLHALYLIDDVKINVSSILQPIGYLNGVAMPFWCDKITVELSNLSIWEIKNKYGNIQIRMVEMVVVIIRICFTNTNKTMVLILKQICI